MKRLLLSLLLSALFLLPAFALAGSVGDPDAIPDEILLDAAQRGDAIYAQANIAGWRMLVCKNPKGVNALFGYKENQDGSYTLKIQTALAVPQGEHIDLYEADAASYGTDQPVITLLLTDKVGNMLRTVSYCLAENSRWLLCEYVDATANTEILVGDGSLTYGHSGMAYGTVQRDLRYVDLSALPKTLEDARSKLTAPPELPRESRLTPIPIPFSGGESYPVYSAPDRTSLRGANGKAQVSTNDWIQVFGQENGFILIQYAIDKDHMRFGYINAESLPKNHATLPLLDFSAQAATLLCDTDVTDDPLASRRVLVSLPAGAQVRYLCDFEDWAYIESSSGDWLRGFVPKDLLNMNRVFSLADHSERQADGVLEVFPDGTCLMTLILPDERIPGFSLRASDGTELARCFQDYDVPNVYYSEFFITPDVTNIGFYPLDADGKAADEALFRVEW